jgi:hypothetical protein
MGPLLCEIFKIKFKNADEKFHESGTPVNTMYLLLLDESGSMDGSDWDSLIIASKLFASEVSADGLKQCSRISIITYGSDA